VLGRSPTRVYRPGDAHSNQEWIWRRDDYEALFQQAPEGAVRLESTPFYLYMPGARRRITEELPDARHDWQLVSRPVETLNRVADFLGVDHDQVTTIPPGNARPSLNRVCAPRYWDA
jgi:hypothetical protein